MFYYKGTDNVIVYLAPPFAESRCSICYRVPHVLIIKFPDIYRTPKGAKVYPASGRSKRVGRKDSGLPIAVPCVP